MLGISSQFPKGSVPFVNYIILLNLLLGPLQDYGPLSLSFISFIVDPPLVMTVVVW
jgi:hypothetical protein